MALNRVSRAPERYLETRPDGERASVRVSLGGVARLCAEWSRPLGRPTARLGLARGGEARAETGGRSRALVQEAKEPYVSAMARHIQALAGRLRDGGRGSETAHPARDLLRVLEAGDESARIREAVWLAGPRGRDA